jgi:hypothetical protein
MSGFQSRITQDTNILHLKLCMHGPEHWFGLLRAWLIIGLFIYVVWSSLELIHTQVNRIRQRISSP